MKNERVTFDTAKLAKEKGFDEFCDESFDENGKASGFTGYDLMKKHNKNSAVHLINTNSEEFEYPNILCTRPTQSLLQRWIREVHNIHVDVHPTLINKKWYPKAVNLDNTNDNILAGRLFDFHRDIFEEALDLGLYVTLKLIPNK